MSPAHMPALSKHIALLRDMARGPAEEWPLFLKRMREIPIVPSSELPGGGLVIAASARVVISVAHEVNTEAARALLKSFADVLQAEYDARFTPPHYARD